MYAAPGRSNATFSSHCTLNISSLIKHSFQPLNCNYVREICKIGYEATITFSAVQIKSNVNTNTIDAAYLKYLV